MQRKFIAASVAAGALLVVGAAQANTINVTAQDCNTPCHLHTPTSVTINGTSTAQQILGMQTWSFHGRKGHRYSIDLRYTGPYPKPGGQLMLIVVLSSRDDYLRSMAECVGPRTQAIPSCDTQAQLRCARGTCGSRPVVPGQSIVGRFPVNGPYAVTLAGYSAATTTPQSHVPQPVSVPYQLVLTIG